MTDLERAEAMRWQQSVGKELGQSLWLVAGFAATLSAFLGLGLLAVRVLG
ncbi:MAG: hypothetical protein M3Q23_15005 [Actinomycetota bacterium]|nr:hypothetical protein [Actinomycetota bacterium]